MNRLSVVQKVGFLGFAMALFLMGGLAPVPETKAMNFDNRDGQGPWGRTADERGRGLFAKSLS